MPVNLDKPHLWKNDIARSVDFYNNWFMTFAPKAFRNARIETMKVVEAAFQQTQNLTIIQPDVLKNHPQILSVLRMATCPPLARDRLIGLSGVSPNLVRSMEINQKIPTRMEDIELTNHLEKIGDIFEKMADPDIIVWKDGNGYGTRNEIQRAITIIADRLCGAIANPIIRNAQEHRQLASLRSWLERHGYQQLAPDEVKDVMSIPPQKFSFRVNVPVILKSQKRINISIDVAIMKKNALPGELPILFEAKSAGDFANVNKRRKEEAIKITQLRETYGKNISFNLFLCGYFDSGYLGYEAAEGIDWVWEHRMDDLEYWGL